MSCVNRNLREFKDAAVRLDIHPDDLELIVHDFINTPGNENTFPSDAEIMERLIGSTFRASESQVKLYKLKGFDQVMEFSTLNDAMNRVRDLSRWFPEEAIHCFRNNRGMYRVHLAVPVNEKLTPESNAPESQIDASERNQEESALKRRTITYTPVGRAERQTYTIEGDKIFNKKGIEVFRTDSRDRRKIYANLAIQEGRAVVVEYRGKRYVVNNKDHIISVTTGDLVWETDQKNGVRRAIIELAKRKFADRAGTPVESRVEETKTEKFSDESFSNIQAEADNEAVQTEAPSTSTEGSVQWARTATNSYEVSTQGDSRFSALRAKFKPGTIIDGVDVSGMTIEGVYQSVMKKSGKGKAPSVDSKLYNPELKTKAEQEDFSYREGYLPLWQEWARQNPELIQELREKSAGKVLTDRFASTRVSQARALAEILNSAETHNIPTKESIQTAEERVAASKLLNKDKIIDVKINEEENLEITIKASTPEAQYGLITFSRRENKWSVQVVPNSELSSEAIHLSPKEQQRVVDAIVPKDLQEYFTSGQEKTDSRNLVEKMTSLNLDSSEADYIIEHSNEGSRAVIRDRWGIYSFSEWTKEDNFVDPTVPAPSIDQLLAERGHTYPEQSTVGGIQEEQGVNQVTQEASQDDITKSSLFKSRFGDWENNPQSASKAVDENGVPIKLWHTSPTSERFEYFDTSDRRIRRNLDGSINRNLMIMDYMSSLHDPFSGRTLSDAELGILRKKAEEEVDKIIENDKAGISATAIYGAASREVSNTYSETIGDAWLREENFLSNSEGVFFPSRDDGSSLSGIENPINMTNENRDEITGHDRAMYFILNNPLIVDAQGRNWNDIPFEDKTESTRTLEQIAKDRGHDGIIVKNVIDIGGYAGSRKISTTTVMAAWENSQVIDAQELERNIRSDQEQQPIDKNNQSYMEKSVSTTQQIDNLNNSSALSSTEVRHIAEQVVYWISDALSEYQANPESLFMNFPEKRTMEGEGESAEWTEENKAKDIEKVKSLSRADLINFIGLDNLTTLCKERVFNSENEDVEFEDLSTYEKADEIYNNWDAILWLASDAFASTEKITIAYSSNGKAKGAKEGVNYEADNFNDSDMQTDVSENESETEHWQKKARTIDIIETMSELVRDAFRQCYVLDSDGNKVKSEFGIYERVDVREAVNSIYKWADGAVTLDQIIAKLQERTDTNPWIRYMVGTKNPETGEFVGGRLNDRSGKEADFQGQFMSIIRHFQSYSIVREKDGKYVSMTVNEEQALKKIADGIEVQAKTGEHPLFSLDGISKEYLEDLQREYNDLLEYKKSSYDFTNQEVKDTVSKSLGYISNILGFYVTPDMIVPYLTRESFNEMMDALDKMAQTLQKNIDDPTYNPFAFEGGIKGNLKRFLRPMTEYLEDIAVAAFYDSGDMYQSYVTPSYTTKLFQKFKLSGQEFDDFILEEYDVPWFHTGTEIERGWRNEWLRLLVVDENAKKIFKHKVQLNFNKHNYMRNMSDMEYTLSLITEYLSEGNPNDKGIAKAWYRMPMLSNKPSSEFIRFYSYRDSNYRETLTGLFMNIFDQEVSRIQTVEMRNLDKNDPRFIKNFDTNGKRFMFLDFMNDYLTGNKKSSELGKLIRKKLNGEKVDSARLNELVQEVIMDTINARAERIVSNWESQGIIEGAKKIENIGTSEAEIRENLINFVWNDTFAAMNIMQLTLTDIAFYADAEDLQKRLAQLHSPGMRGYTAARDYNGNLVTDGTFRTVLLKDIDGVISNIIDNVSLVFDKKIENAPEAERPALRALKESLVGEEGAFRSINVADAQGFSSPTSYRKKALIFGKWSREAEEIYQRLRNGEATYADLKVAFQPLKPFVYSQIMKTAGVEGAPLSIMKTPVQYKNSEYLLIMADALLQGENTGKPNLLRAIFKVMEDSHYDEATGEYRTNGIDTVQFESTTKSGLSGAVDLNDLLSDPNGEEVAIARLKAAIYETTEREIEVTTETGQKEKKTIYETTGQYNKTTVHEVTFEDYSLQQEVPGHFKEHDQSHGSQSRFIIVSELDSVDSNGVPVEYTLPDGRKVSAQEFKTEYENTIAEQIQDSLDTLAEELFLNDIESVKDRNIALSKILQAEILSSPRYGVDLLQACSVDENGRFKIPLGDPIQSKRVEQLINSIIKNRVNKQKIAGGPVVQVSCFGTTRELNIRFKDKNGGLLMTRAEYEKSPIKKMSYEDYIKENQGGIAYFEVFAPIYTNDLFRKFADKNGIINIEAIEALDPDLLKMVGYRIPTEEKYSMAPLKIVGFLPREAGDGIMLPADITLLSGSDFDVDKEYLMRKEYGITDSKIKKGDMHRILFDELASSQKGKLSYKLKTELSELIEQFLEDPFDSSSLVGQKVAEGYLTMTKGAYSRMLRTYVQNRYVVDRPTEGRAYRNNKIVDMTYEILTHETSADKVLNPGNFDPQKKAGYIAEAIRRGYSYEELQGMSIKELKELSSSDKNLSYIDTHIQFYKQNNAAGSLLGSFAVHRIAHAVIESGSEDGSAMYRVNVDKVLNSRDHFTIAGMEFGGFMPFDMRYDRNGQLIGKVLGSLVASAADAVKDPVLNLMNINSSTVNVLTTLIRLGMPFETAAMFLSSSAISKVLDEFNKANIDDYKSLASVVEDRINEIAETYKIDETSPIYNEELTFEELIKGIKKEIPEIEYKTLSAFSKLLKISYALRMPTFATRFNSVSSSVGPLIIDNLITEHTMRQLSSESCIVDSDGNTVDMEDIFKAHPILGKFRQTVDMARTMFGNMPANSNSFRLILDIVEEAPYLSRVVFGDRRVLSSLSDFYQSYVLVKNKVIDPSELKTYIEDFPREFMNANYKEKYADNALIKAIRYVMEKSGRVSLIVDTTGLDTKQREKLSNAWIDLHKVNPELSMQLFRYNFFKGGIGFNPKTFMNLLPTYVKERIPGYIDTYRVLPSVIPERVLEQFLRHNWNNNRLVPRKRVAFSGGDGGIIMVSKDSDVEALKDILLFKINVQGKDRLYKRLEVSDKGITFALVDPLGNNGEYLEIGIEDTKPLTDTTEASNEVSDHAIGKESELNDRIGPETVESGAPEVNEGDKEKLLYQILVIDGVRTEKGATDYIERYRMKSDKEKAQLEKSIKTWFKSRMKELNIEFNEQLVDDLYKTLC